MRPRSPARRVTAGVLLAVAALTLAGCAAGANTAATGGPGAAGFWLGLWHGVISPITFVVSLFNDDVSLYEVHNTGGWYDFGFLLGIMVIFGGNGGRRYAGNQRRRRSAHGG